MTYEDLKHRYEAWSRGEASNSELLNHLIRYHHHEDSQIFMDLWWRMLSEENLAAEERLSHDPQG